VDQIHYDHLNDGEKKIAPAVPKGRHRENIDNLLNKIGYCYGKKGEYGYQMHGHKCGPNSLTQASE
jgi:hypothetical protein